MRKGKKGRKQGKQLEVKKKTYYDCDGESSKKKGGKLNMNGQGKSKKKKKMLLKCMKNKKGMKRNGRQGKNVKIYDVTK